MSDLDLDEVWNGRFTDDVNDEPQQIAQKAMSFEEFERNFKAYIEENSE